MEEDGWGAGGVVEANCKKRVRVMGGGGKVGCSSSSPVHDHPDQFCKREMRQM